MRLKKARILLAHPGSSVYETAPDCGVSSPAQLPRHFKSVHGMTPLELRQTSGLGNRSPGYHRPFQGCYPSKSKCHCRIRRWKQNSLFINSWFRKFSG
jgi:AraC-like DNA-binding protein